MTQHSGSLKSYPAAACVSDHVSWATPIGQGLPVRGAPQKVIALEAIIHTSTCMQPRVFKVATEHSERRPEQLTLICLRKPLRVNDNRNVPMGRCDDASTATSVADRLRRAQQPKTTELINRSDVSQAEKLSHVAKIAERHDADMVAQLVGASVPRVILSDDTLDSLLCNIIVPSQASR
jgi:hypothetical protein